jgi:hypothetical protein
MNAIASSAENGIEAPAGFEGSSLIVPPWHARKRLQRLRFAVR